MNYKDIIIRAAKTFVQTFVPVLIASFKVADVTNLDEWKAAGYTALIAAASAGLSAVWNIIKQYFSSGEKATVTSSDTIQEEKEPEGCIRDEGIEPEDGGFSC